MGGNVSKTAGKEEAAVEKPGEGAAVAAKANGQVFCPFSRKEMRLCVSFLAMNCVNGVCSTFSVASPPRSPGIQGKWPHVTIFTGESFSFCLPNAF